MYEITGQKIDPLKLQMRETFVSPYSGVTLTVVGGSFGMVDEEDVLNGTAERIEVRASADGRHFHRGVWHDGVESDESVWVEVFEYDSIKRPVCVFHGCVDSVSRKVTQTG